MMNSDIGLIIIIGLAAATIFTLLRIYCTPSPKVRYQSVEAIETKVPNKGTKRSDLSDIDLDQLVSDVEDELVRLGIIKKVGNYNPLPVSEEIKNTICESATSNAIPGFSSTAASSMGRIIALIEDPDIRDRLSEMAEIVNYNNRCALITQYRGRIPSPDEDLSIAILDESSAVMELIGGDEGGRIIEHASLGRLDKALDVLADTGDHYPFMFKVVHLAVYYAMRDDLEIIFPEPIELTYQSEVVRPMTSRLHSTSQTVEDKFKSVEEDDRNKGLLRVHLPQTNYCCKTIKSIRE